MIFGRPFGLLNFTGGTHFSQEVIVMVQEKTFRVSIEGHCVQVRSIAPTAGASRDAPVLIFLHEGLGSIGQWRDFPHALVQKTGLSALVFDRYGFGGSDPLHRERDGRYLQRDDISSLLGVLESCAVTAPILIGHSDGGTIALHYAARFPDRPVGLILEAAHVFVEELTLAGIRLAQQAYQEGVLREKLLRYHGTNTDDMVQRFMYDWLSGEFRDWNIETVLPSVLCPVLIIQGLDDEYGTLAQVEAIGAGVSGPVEKLLIPGCGHTPHHQARQEVLTGMSRFIATLTGHTPA